MPQRITIVVPSTRIWSNSQVSTSAYGPVPGVNFHRSWEGSSFGCCRWNSFAAVSITIVHSPGWTSIQSEYFPWRSA